MELIEPNVNFEASYRDYIAELDDAVRVPFPLSYQHDPFSDLVQMLVNQSRGIGLRDGFVPNSTFWLVHGAEILGVSNMWHSLTPSLTDIGGHIGFGVRPSVQRSGIGTKLLDLTLVPAGRLGLSRVLLTCDRENLGSVGVKRYA